MTYHFHFTSFYKWLMNIKIKLYPKFGLLKLYLVNSNYNLPVCWPAKRMRNVKSNIRIRIFPSHHRGFVYLIFLIIIIVIPEKQFLKAWVISGYPQRIKFRTVLFLDFFNEFYS